MALFGLALLCGAGTARAEEGPKAGEKMPLPFAQRPLTLPRMTLAPEVSFDVAHVAFGGLGSAIGVGMEIGARFGILDDLEVGAVVLPLEFSPDFAYGNPRLEATFRFLKGTVEMGARLRTIFGLHSGNTGVILEPGLPILIHIGEAARIDTGVFVAGYAIGNEKGPLVDIDPYFKFPYFAIPGAGRGQDKSFTGIWQTGIAATVYLYLRADGGGVGGSSPACASADLGSRGGKAAASATASAPMSTLP